MTETTTLRVTPRLILGVAILALGLGFTLDNLGLVDASVFWDFWPLALVAYGGVKLLDSSRTGAWVSGLAWIFVGVWWILYNLAIVDAHVFDLWPILLIVAGFYLVRRALTPPERKASKEGQSSQLTGYAILCGLRRNSTSPDFQGGDFVAIMGGAEVDLRQAKISSGEAVLDTFAFWGGLDIRVPPEWTVISQVTPILGGFADKTDQSRADPEQQLIVRGLAIMGGIEIKS